MELRVETHGEHIVIITIDNQPRLNAMPREMMAELAALWDRLDASDCRCIILTGAGDRAFCAGADLSGDLSAEPEMARMVNHALLKTHTYTKYQADHCGGQRRLCRWRGRVAAGY